MGKYILSSIVILLILSCSSNKKSVSKPLYEVLSANNDGGANIRFYEILTEPKEIRMLLSDPDLKKKIKQEDIEKSNFVILNMGELPEGNYKIAIENIEETPDNIIIHVKETKPEVLNTDSLNNVVYPFSVVKINSKKEIIFK